MEEEYVTPDAKKVIGTMNLPDTTYLQLTIMTMPPKLVCETGLGPFAVIRWWRISSEVGALLINSMEGTPSTRHLHAFKDLVHESCSLPDLLKLLRVLGTRVLPFSTAKLCMFDFRSVRESGFLLSQGR